jgi:predicted RNA-binding protein with PIN domain
MDFLTATVNIEVNDKNVKVKLEDIKREFTRTSSESEKSVRSLSGTLESTFLRFAGYYISAKGLWNAMKFVTREAMQQEDATFRLAAALRATGTYSNQTMRDLQAFASEMQRVTVYSDNVTLSLMQTLTTLGVESEQLKLATQMTIGLADSLGLGAEATARYVALALQGEYTMLRRYVPALRDAKNETEALTILTDVAAKGFEISQAKAETTSGSIERMKNALGNLGAEIGEKFLPQIKQATNAITENKEGIASWIKTASLVTPIGAAFEVSRVSGAKPPVKSQTFMKYYAEWLDEQGKFGETRVIREKATAAQMVDVTKMEVQEQIKAIESGATTVLDMKEEVAKAEVALAKHTQKEIKDTTIKSLDDQIKALKMVNSGQARTMQSAQEFVKIQERLGQGTKATADMWDLYREKEKKVLSLTRWREFADGVNNSLGSAFDRLIFQGQKFGDFMNSLLTEILQDLTRVQIIKPFTEMLGGGITSLTGSLLGGVGVTPAPVAHSGLTSEIILQTKETCLPICLPGLESIMDCSKMSRLLLQRGGKRSLGVSREV